MKSDGYSFFGAHPDDIEIGMGGTVAKLNGMGYDVNLVVVTLPNFVKTDTKEQRRIEATMSAKVMGSKQPEFLDLSPDEIIFKPEICGLDTIKLSTNLDRKQFSPSG